MQVHSFAYDLEDNKWSVPALPDADSPRTLVLVFGAPEVVEQPECMLQLAKAYPRAVLLGCSTSGEIHGTSIRDKSLSVTVTRFDKTDLVLASMEVDGPGDSYTTGEALAKKLASRPGLRAVLVLCDGLNVNGSELVRGLNRTLDESVVVTGGLAGDGTRFKQTWVAIGSKLKPNVVAVVGFYGDYVVVGHGSKGGWDKFGPERVVTRSEGNVLYELDGKPALQLYKEYLGEKAKDLPASGLFFPLSVRASSNDEKALVRTVLAVDHEKNSLTFAGDLPKGYLAQLMRADFDRLIGGASLASYMAKETRSSPALTAKDSLVLAISCVGRRLVLGARTEEEVEAVLDGLPQTPQTHITGFYAYGEISPYATGHCDLHNQTMTLTVFSESPTPIVKKAPPARDDRAMPPTTSAQSPTVATPTRAAKSPTSAAPTKAAKSPASAGSTDNSEVSEVMMTSNTKAIAPISAYPQRGAAVTRMPLQASGATGANVQKQRRGDITVLTITGRLTESFKGEALGRELSGNLVIDLAGVERITSFGVREWLAMLGAMQNVRRMHLIRCSEAVVNQLSMIRKFAGSGQIVSFFAPYICSSCAEQFERGFDCEHDAVAIREGQPETATCPQCGGEGNFDDDARSYFAFAVPHQNTPVPLDVRAIQDERDAQAPEPPREAVEKTIEGNVTRVRVQGKLNASMRWKRVLDGIEGALIVDLGGAMGVESAGIENLEQALTTLGPEVTSIGIERCPALLVERFARTGAPKRLRIVSAALDAYCRSCAVHRPALVSLDEHGEALSKGTAPHVHCKRCNGELELRGDASALRFFASQLARATPSAMEPVATSLGGLAVTPTPAQSTASTRPGASATAARPLGGTFAIGALSLAVVGLMATHLIRPAALPAAAAPAAATVTATNNTAPPRLEQTSPAGSAQTAASQASGQGTTWLQSVDLPPAWVERPFIIEGADVLVVGKGESSATPEMAMSQARNDAIVRILKQVQQELVGGVAHDFLQARRREPDKTAVDAIANRYLRQFGTTATPERVDAVLRKRETGIEGFARYKLPRGAYQELVAAYRETANIQGMVIGRFFPLLETTLRTEGELVVLSVQRSQPAELQGVRAGDAVLAVESRSIVSLDNLTKVWNDHWSSMPGRGSVSLEIETSGAKRVVRFNKPGPQP